MNSKKKLKGFTLLELVIVLALFSVILTLVMSFISPVTRLMKRATAKERTAAYVDNVSEYINNSVHYAKFIRVFNGGYCDVASTGTSKNELQCIRDMVSVLYENAVDDNGTPIEGRVRVLKLINTAEGSYESGHIYESVYNFVAGVDYGSTHIDEGVTQIVTDRDVLNPEHFEEYNYYYELGFRELVPISDNSLGDAYAPKPNEYYSRMIPLVNGNNVPVNPIQGKSLAISVVSYENKDGVSAMTMVNDGTNDITLFRSPANMSTISMALVNAERANLANEVIRVEIDRDGAGVPKRDSSGNYLFKTIPRSAVGTESHLNIEPTGAAKTSNNIYIIYIVPDEIYDTDITLN